MLRIINAKLVLPNNYNVANEAFQPGMFAQFKRDGHEDATYLKMEKLLIQKLNIPQLCH